jgi:HJR/Mrr/RecB family endonuclease
MFGLAAICWATWKSHNRACFEKKSIKNPCEIIFSACVFMYYWAGLYPEEAQKVINAKVDVMM